MTKMPEFRHLSLHSKAKPNMNYRLDHELVIQIVIITGRMPGLNAPID
jgi:hypothetical protein